MVEEHSERAARAARNELLFRSVNEQIRRAARSNRMKLHDLVRKIKPGEPTPEELSSLVGNDRQARADV